MDFYITLAFSVLLQLLKDSKRLKQFAPALRKIYINLHAARAEFLRDGDAEMLGLNQGE
jgi:hypothetical protein